MNKHYNLYYLFLEDKKKHTLLLKPSGASEKNLEKFFKKIKPPQNLQPLINSKTK